MYNGNLFAHPVSFQCKKFVTRHKPLSQQHWLKRLSKVPALNNTIDMYNSGPAIELLETRVAQLLGKESAMFVVKGMVGQNSALKQWSQLTGANTIAVHPQSHIMCDESDAYRELLALNTLTFGQPGCAVKTGDLEVLHKDLAAICIELPVRRAGFLLPDINVLKQIKQFGGQNNTPVHIDGARLLESAHHYQVSYDQLADYGDSVYVSLYKSLGAMAGGVIAGDRDFIDSLLPWRSRFGGDLFTVFPYVLSALWGLDHYLPRISEFHNRAKELSVSFKNTFGEKSLPNEVQTNGFLIDLPIKPCELEKRVLDFATYERVWLCDRIFNVNDSHISRIEIQVGDALDDWTNQELVTTIAGLIE
jgi:threonine aldolase